MDLSLSNIIRSLEFGVLDYALFVPGCIFSQPVSIFAFLMPLLPLVVDATSEWFFVGVIPFWIVGVYGSYRLITRTGPIPRDIKILEILLPAVCIPWSSYMAPKGGSAIMFALASAALAQLISATLKDSVGRKRPPRMPNKTRVVDLYQFVAEDPAQHESFPSGDATQAAVWFVSFALCSGANWWSYLAFLPMFGRVYFWCHYVGDVVGGGLIGLSSTLIVNWIQSPFRFTIPQILAVNLVFYPVTLLQMKHRERRRDPASLSSRDT